MANDNTEINEIATIIGHYCAVKGIDILPRSGEEFYNMINKINQYTIEPIPLKEYNFSIEKNWQSASRGYLMGQYIASNLKNYSLRYAWIGNNNDKENPEDIIIGSQTFSLKEKDDILLNGGALNITSALTGKDPNDLPKTISIYQDFAPREFDQWFSITYALFVNYLYVNKEFNFNKKSFFYCDYKNCIGMRTSGSDVLWLPKSYDTVKDFMSIFPASVGFMKKISKIDSIKENLEYRRCKYTTEKTAGDGWVAYIEKLRENNSECNKNLYHLLRLKETGYYYIRGYGNNVSCRWVPSINDMSKKGKIQVELKNIELVDNSEKIKQNESTQLNIKVNLYNKITRKTLTLRIECRGAHGALMPTPETKIYIDNIDEYLRF